MHHGLRPALALLAGTLFIAACTSTPAATSPAPATSAAAAATTAAPTPTPCTTQSVLTGPAQASLPVGATPAPTKLPIVAANISTVAISKIPIPPISGKTASIDIMVIDQDAHRLYVADRGTNGVDIFDVATPCAKYLKTIDFGSGTNGVVLAKNVNKLVAGLNNSSIGIADISTPGSEKVIATIPSGGKARVDEGDYDPKDKKVYIANSDDAIVSVVDMTTNQVVKKFENMGGALEQPRYNSVDGMFYMTGSDDNVIFQFDPTKDTLVKKYPIGVPCAPTGIDINPKSNHAMVVCSDRKANINLDWDIAAGKIAQTFDQAGAGDMAFYSPKADRFFVANSNFNRGAVLSIFAGNPLKYVTSIQTAAGSHSVAYDETNGIVYTQDQNPNEGALFSFPAPK